jgi:hypothetical protein
MTGYATFWTHFFLFPYTNPIKGTFFPKAIIVPNGPNNSGENGRYSLIFDIFADIFNDNRVI